MDQRDNRDQNRTGKGDDLSSALGAAIADTVADLGVTLVSVEVKGPRNKRVVKLVADAEDGLDVDRIAAVSNAVADITDDVVPGSYTLEVSSPGVDRPLTAPAHFTRNLGRKVQVRHSAGTGDTQTTGEVLEVTDSTVTLESAEGRVDIPFDELFEGRVVLPW